MGKTHGHLTQSSADDYFAAVVEAAAVEAAAVEAGASDATAEDAAGADDALFAVGSLPHPARSDTDIAAHNRPLTNFFFI